MVRLLKRLARPRQGWRYILLIVALPLLLFWRWVWQGEVLYWGTILFQFWPWHQLVKASLLNARWPLWNPLLGNGTPLLANLQSAVFYPPNLLPLLLPVEHGLTASIVLHLMLAGLFMYVYTRRGLGLNPFAAAVAALTFMFSGYLVGRTQFITMVHTAAWIPVTLFLCERITAGSPTGTAALKNTLWLGVVLAIQLLAGHAQLWYYNLWLAGGYVLFRSWQTANSNGSRDWAAVVRPIWQAGSAVGLSLLLAAVQLAPTLEFMLQSPRSNGAEQTFALTYSFWPWRLITLLAPDFFGHPARANYWGYANFWEDHAYAGILPVLLAAVAVRRAWRVRPGRPYHRVIPFFAGLIPISLILAMGWNTPFYLWVFNTIPGFSYFQAPARLLIWYTVAVAVLAGIGAHVFTLPARHRPFWRRLLVAGIGLVVAGVAGSLVVSGRSQTFLTATAAAGLWFVLSVAVLLFYPAFTARHFYRPAWQWLALALVALDLLVAGWPLIPTAPAQLFHTPAASAEFLKSRPGSYRFLVDAGYEYTTKFNRYFRFNTFGPRDVAYWQTFRESLAPNTGIYAELPSANNDDPLVTGRWQQLVTLLRQASPRQQVKLLQLMNVGYVVGGQAGVGPVRYRHGDTTIRQVPDPLPRAYFVAQHYPVKNDAAAIARLTAPDFDSRQEVVIIKDTATALPANTGNPATVNNPVPVPVNELSPTELLLTVDAPASGYVVLTDTYFPGWQATVDGQPAAIWPANLAFRAVAVSQGTHRLQFRYRPRGFTVGLWVSTVSLLGVLVAGKVLYRFGTNRQVRKQH